MTQEKYTITLDRDQAVGQLIAHCTRIDSIVLRSSKELMERNLRFPPLAVFVDYHLEGEGRGVAWIPRIRARWPHAAILVLIANTAAEEVGKALAAGAMDFLSKPLVQPELAARVQARIFEMSLRSAGEFQAFGNGRFSLRKRLLEGPLGVVYLSPLQADLMQFMLQSDGMLVAKDAVKKAIWGQIVVSDNALDRRLSEMRKILKDSGVSMQLVSEYGKGIALQPTGPLAPSLVSA